MIKRWQYLVLCALIMRGVCSRMICGKYVKLCGVLTLESGLGPNEYRHVEPTVHGLWPQVGNYGTSQCILPDDMEPAKKLYTCYEPLDSDITESHQLKFENHEWLKHGRCAGVKDVNDYFHQVCSLSLKPLKLMKRGKSLDQMVRVLKKNNYPVFYVDEHNKQIQLSACFNAKRGEWVLSNVRNFDLFCS